MTAGTWPESSAHHSTAAKTPGSMKSPSLCPGTWLMGTGFLQRAFPEAWNGHRGAGRTFPGLVTTHSLDLMILKASFKRNDSMVLWLNTNCSGFSEGETHQNNPVNRIQELNSIHTSERTKYSWYLAKRRLLMPFPNTVKYFHPRHHCAWEQSTERSMNAP